MVEADAVQFTELTPEFIARNNREAQAFWAEIVPAIRAITQEECQAIFDEWREGLDCREVALAWRARIGMVFDDRHATTVGMRLCHEVLERLGRYDDDLRPDPRAVTR